jgi:hypothetical protein
MAPAKAEQVERCRREVEACRRAGTNPNQTPVETLGAMQGEVDWLVALQIAEEDRRCSNFPRGVSTAVKPISDAADATKLTIAGK